MTCLGVLGDTLFEDTRVADCGSVMVEGRQRQSPVGGILQKRHRVFHVT